MMRKYILTCIALLLVSQSAQAAEPSALLYGNGKVQVFMGKSALENAHAAAIDGDTITLSAGSFYVPNDGITKSVYICGSGAFGDTSEQTIIDYGLTIKAEHTTVEGIRLTGYTSLSVNANNVTVKRCYISKLGFFDLSNYYARFSNTTISQCCLVSIEDMNNTSSLLFYNCTIGYFSSSLWGLNSDAKNSRVVNCVLYSSVTLPYAVFENNIIEASTSYGLQSQSIFRNNLFYADSSPSLNFPSGCEHTGDMYSTYAEVFNSQQTYPANPINVPNGGDGKPVGIYGGEGFTSQPETPTVTASISEYNIFGKPSQTIDVTAWTNASNLRIWWNGDYTRKQDVSINNETGAMKSHKVSLRVPSSARGKGPRKGVATLHIAALSSNGVMSAPISYEVTYSMGPTLTASSTLLHENEVVTLKWSCTDFPGGHDSHAVYYSRDGGPWILWNPNASYDSSLGSYGAMFKGKKGNYHFVVSVRTYINGNFVRTPIDDEWSVQVVYIR